MQLHQIAHLSEAASGHEKAALAGLLKTAVRQQHVVSAFAIRGDPVPAEVKQEVTAGAVPEASRVTGSPAPHLAKSARMIASLLSGLQTKARASGKSDALLVLDSGNAEKLQISTDEFRGAMEGAASSHYGAFGGDDSMQFTPDGSHNHRLEASATGGTHSLGHSRSDERINPFSANGRLFREAAAKLSVAKMFSLHEEEEGAGDDVWDSPRALPHRTVLSRFHTEEQEEQRRQALLEHLTDSAVYPQQLEGAPSVSKAQQPVHTFSSSGFQLVGDSVKAAADSRSMLHLLRVYSGAEQQHESLPQAPASDTSHYVDRGSVLQSLRNLPIPEA